MPKIPYTKIKFAADTLKIITAADVIIQDYQSQGFDLTLRQLYYQFVAKGWLPNQQKWYDKLQCIVNDARMAGLLDWDAIVDRTRNLRSLRHWNSPEDVVQTMGLGYQEDLWANQPNRVEVWIEKDALAGILDVACPGLDVPYFSCRGYTSASEMWGAAMRIMKRLGNGQRTVILHLGDHDPSGVDMSRDIKERLATFISYHMEDSDTSKFFEVRRIALKMSQIEEYKPPPNPAKQKDARFKKYVEKYGHSSWELDALDPAVLVALVRKKIKQFMDPRLMAKALEQQKEKQLQLKLVGKNWQKAVEACGGAV
jgi:hypothetical protein